MSQPERTAMEVAVFDTYVKRRDGRVMHFDVIVPAKTQPQLVLEYGTKYLQDKAVVSTTLTSRECRYCHTQGVPPSIEQEITANGYYIYEMEHCD
jgi:hypothetical protein